MSPRPFAWIADPAQLVAGVERWSARDTLAVDTEFVFERTFRPRLGLIQVATDAEIALVDPLACGDLEALGDLMATAGHRVVMHSGDADVSILKRATGAVPAVLFDTQIAAAFCGLGPGLSYGALVRTLHQVELPKHETRTDWLRRPLRPEQLRYAAEDVEYLIPMAAELERRLRELGRFEWVAEESARICALEESTPEAAWKRVRGIGRLRPRQQAIARNLSAWREREADRRDLARPFLLRDETLVALARLEPATAAPPNGTVADAVALVAGLPGYDARRHKGHAAAWLAALARARAEAPELDESPPPRASRAEVERRDRLDRALGKAITQLGRELDLAPELLLSRRQRQHLIAESERGELPSAALSGFRKHLLGDLVDAVWSDRR